MTSQPCTPPWTASWTAPWTAPWTAASPCPVIIRGILVWRVWLRRIWVEIALDLGAGEQRGDARGIVEGAVEREGDVGDLPQVDHSSHLALQEDGAALEPGHALVGIDAGERHHEGRGVAQIGADPHLDHGDVGIAQRRVAQGSRPQQLGQRVAQLFPTAQLPLAGGTRPAGAVAPGPAGVLVIVSP